MGRSSTDGTFLQNVYNAHTFQEELGKQVKSHAWSSFGSGRASIGEISDPVRFLGLLSEGTLRCCLISFPQKARWYVVIIVFVLRME